MREFENSNDDIAFDRLVDGELSAGERRSLLESLDTVPDGWRRCAMAFLEAQSWGNDLRQLVRESDQDLRATAPPSVAHVAIVRRPMRQALTWAAIAASLLIAFSLGVMQRNDGTPIANVPAESPSEQIADAVPAPQPPVSDNTEDGDALTLWAQDAAGRPRSFRVPLMDAGTLDRELGVEFQSGLPADVRARLQDDGYHLQSKRRYAPLWFENGQRMVLPVEDTRIVPVSQNVY